MKVIYWWSILMLMIIYLFVSQLRCLDYFGMWSNRWKTFWFHGLNLIIIEIPGMYRILSYWLPVESLIQTIENNQIVFDSVLLFTDMSQFLAKFTPTQRLQKLLYFFLLNSQTFWVLVGMLLIVWVVAGSIINGIIRITWVKDCLLLLASWRWY